MLDIRLIRENPEKVTAGLKLKNYDGDINALLKQDKQKRELQEKADALKNQRNVVSKEISELKRDKKDASELIVEMQSVSKEIKELDQAISDLEEKIQRTVFEMPNMPNEKAPVGKTEDDNVEIRQFGEKPTYDFTLKDHFALGNDLGLFDFKRGAKISGSGFPLYTGMGAKLERSMLNFMLDFHVDNHGYTEVFPPFLVNREATEGTGQLPKLEEDMYHCGVDDMFLIPTAEVPVTNIHKGEIIKEADLPISYTAYSACFRREAGSYGKDTKGFQRLHQFNKVEMVKFVTPETSYEVLESLLLDAEEILQALGLHYRVVELCTGDISFASAKTYDIEVWSPAQEKYLEVSSVSNFIDFQARRIGIRYRRQEDAKVDFVHTLNGSGVATPRLLIALLETYQNADGTITVPEKLRSYVGRDLLSK